MQNFKPIKANDFMSRSREVINSNFDCIASDFSGNSFPTSNLIPNMSCFRTDQKKLYRLNPDMRTWRLAIDFSGDKVTIENAHQSENALKSDALKAEHVVSITTNKAKTGFVIVSEESGKKTSKEEELSMFDSLKQQLLDFCFPVGYVMTTASSVNPSETHGGTWKLITEGTFIVAAGNSSQYKQGQTGGEATHKLTIDETPSHHHNVTLTSNGKHTHTRGTMNITGTFGADDRMFNSYSGAFSKGASANTGSQKSEWGNVFDFDASRSWTGATSENGEHSHEVTMADTGGGKAHNNIPPYIAMYMWQRVK